jgi:hypothetical protein
VGGARLHHRVRLVAGEVDRVSIPLESNGLAKELQAMGLTWKDLVTTVFMGAIAAVYVAFLGGTGSWLISSARGTTLAVFVLGLVGGCILSAAGDFYRGPQSRAVRAWRVIASVLGAVAFAAAVAGLASGSTVALAVLVATTGALWLIATGRHALMAPHGPGRTTDNHEVVNSGQAARS